MLVVIIRSIAWLSCCISFFSDKNKLVTRSRVYYNCLSSSCNSPLWSPFSAVMKLTSCADLIWIGLSASRIDLSLISMPSRRFGFIQFFVVFASWLCSEISDRCLPVLIGGTGWGFFKLCKQSLSLVIHEFGFCSSTLRIVASGASST